MVRRGPEERAVSATLKTSFVKKSNTVTNAPGWERKKFVLVMSPGPKAFTVTGLLESERRRLSSRWKSRLQSLLSLYALSGSKAPAFDQGASQIQPQMRAQSERGGGKRRARRRRTAIDHLEVLSVILEPGKQAEGGACGSTGRSDPGEQRRERWPHVRQQEVDRRTLAHGAAGAGGIVHLARGDDDACTLARGLHVWQEEVREQEVPEMVHADCLLKAVFGPADCVIRRIETDETILRAARDFLWSGRRVRGTVSPRWAVGGGGAPVSVPLYCRPALRTSTWMGFPVLCQSAAKRLRWMWGVGQLSSWVFWLDTVLRNRTRMGAGSRRASCCVPNG